MDQHWLLSHFVLGNPLVLSLTVLAWAPLAPRDGRRIVGGVAPSRHRSVWARFLAQAVSALVES